MFKAKLTRPDLLSDRTFTTSEVSQIAQVSLRQLQWWDERKIFSPGREDRKRAYLPAEVLEVIVIAELRRKEFSLQGTRRVASFLEREGGRFLSQVLSGDTEGSRRLAEPVCPPGGGSLVDIPPSEGRYNLPPQPLGSALRLSFLAFREASSIVVQAPARLGC